MKRISFITALLLLSTIGINAQKFKFISKLPEKKEDFTKESEENFIQAAKWLETTQITSDLDYRTRVNAWVIAWITNCPTVTVTVRSSLLKPFDKNSQLLPVFMGGYTRYCLENNYSTDELQSNLAGMRAAINCYNLGGDVKKDKDLNKVVDAEKDGKLEEWIKEAMAKDK